ncbi:MAG: hypothetical protein O2895_01500 [Chloroflexi bacterium]|nr:hypothetical protein [Chloroflexota bacterium]
MSATQPDQGVLHLRALAAGEAARTRPGADWPLVAVHALLLAAYALPWVGGSFGSRTAISAFELGRFTGSTLAIASEPGTWTLLAFAALPALAADGLVLSTSRAPRPASTSPPPRAWCCSARRPGDEKPRPKRTAPGSGADYLACC